MSFSVTENRQGEEVEYFMDEPMENLMCNHPETYPLMHVWRDSLKYVFATLNGEILPWMRVNERQVDEVYRKMHDYVVRQCPDETERQEFLDGMNEMWPRLRRKLFNNRGLWKLMMDVGAESLSFARFPVDLVPRAIALESAFGVNYDNAGIYRELLRVPDISMRCAVREPEFVELRRRAVKAKRTILSQIPELESFRDAPSSKKIGTVITAGGELLIELRRLTLAQIQSLRIVACDIDKTLLKDLDVVFQFDYGVSFAETGIEYRTCTIEELLKDERLYNSADVVLMDGIMSYCQSEMQMQRYIYGAERMRKPTGVIFCDLTVLDPSLVRCAVVEEWKSEDKNYAMHPELSAKSAVNKIARICRRLDFKMEYEIDKRNPRPLGVIFWINSGCSSTTL